MKKLFIIILCLFTMTGCYNYKELKTLGIASSMLIDYANDEYKVIVEINENQKTKTYNGKGSTISEALENTLLNTSKEVYLSHLNTVMFTKSVDVETMVAYFIREPSINTSFYFLLCEDDKVYEKYDEDLGIKIYNILKRHNVYNVFYIIKAIYNDNKDIILPYLKSNGEISSGYIFKDNVPVYEIDYNNVEIYKLLDNILNSNIIAKGYDGFIEINVDEAKTQFNIEDDIVVDINLEATVTQYENDLNLDRVADVKKAQKLLDEEIAKKSKELIDILKVYNSDIFGLDTLINNKYHDIDIHWYDYEFDFNVNTHINKKGLLLS